MPTDKDVERSEQYVEENNATKLPLLVVRPRQQET